MFGNAIGKLPHNYGILRTICPVVTAVRGHKVRGKPYGIAKTIEQRLQSELTVLRLCSISINFQYFDSVIFEKIKNHEFQLV